MRTSRCCVFPDPDVFPPDDILRGENHASLDAFLTAILGEDHPASAAAFAAAVFCEHNFNPNEPRDERGRWTTGGSDTHGVRGTSGTSGSSGVSYDDWLDAIKYRAPATSPRTLLTMAPAERPSAEPPPETSRGSGDVVVAGPSVTNDTKLTTSDWFEKHVWGPLQRNGGTSYSRQHLEKVFFTGCIGLATLTTAGQFHPRDPVTDQVIDQAVPDVRKGYSEFDDAVKYRDKQNKDNPIKREGTTISGGAPRRRMFALLYSSKNETYPTAEPTKKADGSYDLSSNDLLLTIAERSGPGATNFDFFTYSEPGDPWYNAARPWIHADEGGKNMELKATDKKGIEWERHHNNSDFDKLFYFVAPERQFPKPK